MTLGLCYWILMLIWVVVGTVGLWPASGERVKIGVAAPTILTFLLFLCVGWAVFGAPIKGG